MEIIFAYSNQLYAYISYVNCFNWIIYASLFFFQCNFNKKEFGQPKVFVVNATMIEYANRIPARAWFQDVLNKRVPVNAKDGYINSSIKVNNLKAWSKYRIQVAVFNEDGKMSNYSFVMIDTKQGSEYIMFLGDECIFIFSNLYVNL